MGGLPDKLHNLGRTVHDLEKEGPSFWTKFNSAAQDQVWFYQECVDIFTVTACNLSSPQEEPKLYLLPKPRFNSTIPPAAASSEPHRDHHKI